MGARSTVRLGLLWVALALGLQSPALADEADQNDGAQPSGDRGDESPPDVVVLKSGGMVRGTISEMDPAGDVVIRTTTGKLRSFAMSEVEFAGPKERMPTGSRKPAASGDEKPKRKPMRTEPRVNADAVEVNLRANLPEVTFHLKMGSANFEGLGQGWTANGGLMTTAVSGSSNSYAVICTAPCTATLPAGTHRLALSLEGGKSIEAEQSVTLDGPAQVEGTYSSNSGVRTAGWVIGIAGGLAGLGMMFAAFPSSDPDDEESGDSTLMLAGTGVAIASFITAWIMISVDDDADVQAAPTMAKLRHRPRRTAIRWQGAGFSF